MVVVVGVEVPRLVVVVVICVVEDIGLEVSVVGVIGVGVPCVVGFELGVSVMVDVGMEVFGLGVGVVVSVVFHNGVDITGVVVDMVEVIVVVGVGLDV